MEPDDITPKLVEQALRALRYHEDPPARFADLDFVAALSHSRAERIYHFERFLIETVEQRLAHYRREAKLPPVAGHASREAVKAALAADFEPQRSSLEMWSALYYRYIEADAQLEVSELEAASGQHERQFRRRVEAAIRQLTRLIRDQEIQAHRTHRSAYLRAGLESPDYRQLYGVHGLRQQLVQLLRREDGPRFVSLEGIGGIGKTALARATVEALAGDSDLTGIIWISARQEKLHASGELEQQNEAARSLDDVVNRLWLKLGYDTGASVPAADRLLRLAPLLANTRYLIVIDNLETVADSRLLIPKLYPLAGATRFLLTSRESLGEFDFVETRGVPELSPEDSAALVGSEVERLSRGSVMLPQTDLDRIYAVIGGVPLALKLIAAQAAVLPVDRCLDGLRAAERQPERLFNYIYRHTWRLLDETARRLLFAVHDVIGPEGARLLWLERMGAGVGLTPAEFQAALAQLHRYSLLEVTRTGDDSLYRLHRLTITFLQHEFAGSASGGQP
ncbi:MAG: hypothetical protein HZC41_02310 [Chloroflexi bacterium]|nr:hypothetical protein [Chloroflexota bacterium]